MLVRDDWEKRLFGEDERDETDEIAPTEEDAEESIPLFGSLKQLLPLKSLAKELGNNQLSDFICGAESLLEDHNLKKNL